MIGERGASRWTVGALIAVVIGVIVSLGVALGWFGGDDEGGDGTVAGELTTTTNTPTTNPPTTEPTATPTTVATATATGDHPLCDLHADYLVALDDHTPVETSEDLQAFMTAQAEFYEVATEVLEPPDRDGFAELHEWSEDVAAYYEALDWDPSPGLEVLAENPPPQVSGEAVAAVTETLENLCGVVPTPDQMTP